MGGECSHHCTIPAPKSNEWFHLMLDKNIPTVDALAERFNTFLYGLTSHFTPLQTVVDITVEVPREFLVDSRTAFKALLERKTKKSSGPDCCLPSSWLLLFLICTIHRLSKAWFLVNSNHLWLFPFPRLRLLKQSKKTCRR